MTGRHPECLPTAKPLFAVSLSAVTGGIFREWTTSRPVWAGTANALVDQLMWMPEIARLITSRWTSEVPSKMV